MNPSSFATYFDTNNPLDALRVLKEADAFDSSNHCSHGWKFWEASGDQERAVTQAVVMDKVGTEGKAWFVHGDRCDLRRGPNWIIAEGWICRGKMGKIGVLIHAFIPESEVSKPNPEDEEAAHEFLRSKNDRNNRDLQNSLLWKAAEALARTSQLKGGEVVRGFVSDLLTIASPVWVKTPEGARQLGATTCELGLTTAAKSQRERMLREWLECGKYDTGRKTVAGLTAGVEKIEGGGWVLRKGLLPSWDLSWIVLDNMPPHAIDSQIESRRDGVVTITAIRNAELWARARLKLLSNPSQPFDETLYKCTLLKEYDSKLIARFAFAIYTYGATTDERYDAKLIEPESGDEELLAMLKIVLRSNLSRETTFTVPPHLWSEIIRCGKLLEENYGCEDVPLLLRSTPYKISLLTYCFALLEGFKDPEQRHVKLAYDWLDYCARDIELDKYVVTWRGQHLLADEEYNVAKTRLQEWISQDVKEHGGEGQDTYTYLFVEYVAKNSTVQRDELAAHLEVDPKTVTAKANNLKGLGLLRSDKDGYHFTAKGVRFFKRWLDSPDAPHSPGSSAKEGTPRDGEEGGLGSKSEVIKGIKGVKSCEVCGKPDAQTITRIGEHTSHDLCSEHNNSHPGSLSG
jgi:hypothetical protein